MALLDQIGSAATGAERYEAMRAYLAADDVVVARWGYAFSAQAEAGVLMRRSVEAYELEQEDQSGVAYRLKHQWYRLRVSIRSIFRE